MQAASITTVVKQPFRDELSGLQVKSEDIDRELMHIYNRQLFEQGMITKRVYERASQEIERST